MDARIRWMDTRQPGVKRRINDDGDVLSSANELLLPLPLSQFAGLRGKEKRGMKKKRGDGLQDQLFMLG